MPTETRKTSVYFLDGSSEDRVVRGFLEVGGDGACGRGASEPGAAAGGDAVDIDGVNGRSQRSDRAKARRMTRAETGSSHFQVRYSICICAQFASRHSLRRYSLHHNTKRHPSKRLRKRLSQPSHPRPQTLQTKNGIYVFPKADPLYFLSATDSPGLTRTAAGSDSGGSSCEGREKKASLLNDEYAGRSTERRDTSLSVLMSLIRASVQENGKT